MADATCLHCGSRVPPKGRSGPRASYCSRDCRNAAARNRAAIAYAEQRDQINSRKREESQGLREATIKVCPQCSQSFSPVVTMRQRFCSERCLSSACRDSQTKTCSADDCDRMVRAKGMCNTHYNAAHHPDSRTLWPADPERRRRTLRTQSQKRRARLRDPNAENVDRDVVGERDRWKCGVCRKPVDRSLRYPDPLSPSLDHVVPLSQGGEHVYANTRITHLGCNLARSNRGGNEQLMLIG